jgi:LysM repeat protein
MPTKDRWSALSMIDKADLIKLMVENGVTSLDDMKLYYNGGNLFGEGGPEDRQKMYNSVKDRIIQQAQVEQMVTQPKMGEQPLEPLEYDIANSITEVGDIEYGKQLFNNINEGNFKEAGLGLAGLLLPNIVARGINRGVRNINKDVLNKRFQERLIKEITDEPEGQYLYNVKPVERRPLTVNGRVVSDPKITQKTGKIHVEGESIVPGRAPIKGDEYIWLSEDKPYIHPDESDFIKIGVEDANATTGNVLSTGPTPYPLSRGFSKTAPTLESYRFVPLGRLNTSNRMPMWGTYGKVKYKGLGGNLFDWGGKFPVSRYEDRPDAAFEETLMTRPPEITKRENTPKYVEKERKQYTVQTGDSLSKIAKQNDVPLDSLLSFNPQIKNPNVIHTGDNIFLERQEFEKPKEIKDIRETRQLESQLSSKEAIMAATHKSNYAIIDKDAQKIEVYNPQGELLGKVDTVTGQSNLDYNTKTYTDSRGELIDMQGNNSTPAGITEITSTGSYHGVPSFQRSRVGNDDKVKKTKAGEADTIASALHFEHGVGTGKNRSNGCVRLSTEGAQILGQILGVGDRIYTLPQQEGSRFVLRDGKLSFIADNVFGKDETSADTTKVNGQIKSKADWDDYNVTVNRTYSPLKIVTPSTGKKEYDSNVKTFSTSLENNKENLMKNLGLSSYEYNTLAMLAMGIAQQESKFGTSTMYKLKNLDVTIGNRDINVQKAVKDIVGNNSYDSLGIGQIKYKGDNKNAQDMYKKAGVTDDHNDISNEAKGIVARLAHIYKNQYLGKSKLFDEAGISTEEALAFLYNGGKVSEIKNAVEKNENIRELMHEVPDGVVGRVTGKTKLVSTLDYANKVLNNMNKFRFLGEY